MASRGIDIRESGDRLLFRALLQDADGNILTTGNAYLRLYELQSNGSLKSYDFNDHTFKTTALTTETVELTHRAGNNNNTNTGLWTYTLTTLTGFTAGAVYFECVTHEDASPPLQAREFQFGSGILADVKEVSGTAQTASDLGAQLSIALTNQANIEEDTQDIQDQIGTSGDGLTALGDTRIDNLDAAITSRSSHAAADVWAVNTRTLSSYGSLSSDIATAVWSAISRTLTDLDPESIRDAIGMATANLDSQLDDIINAIASVNGNLATIQTDVGYIQTDITNVQKVLRNKKITNPSTGIMTVYDDDGTTVLFTAQIWENTAMTQPYRGRGLEVQERLE